jgi:hypothetical protein
MRRDRLTMLLGLAALAFVAVGAARPAAPPVAVTVYKSPSCGCCSKWVDHMRKEGFTVTAHDMDDVTPFKREVGVPGKLESCHTAVVDGYVIEGHVPAADVRRLLAERPKVVGLSVPGMVTGSPGMEGGTPDPYDVVAFDAKSRTTVFARH